MASTSTTETSIDCEGPCCCRCTLCKGVGWWSSYDITFAASDGLVLCSGGVPTFFPGASDAVSTCTGGNTFTVSSGGLWPILFGSAGGTGTCVLGVAACVFGFIELWITPTGGYVKIIYSGVCAGGIFYDLISFDCRTGGTASGNPTVVCPDTCINHPHYVSTISITPSAGATWNQCGQNSDGTTYTGSTSLTNPTFKQGTKAGAVSLPTVPHPDRCNSYNGRDEFRTGCNGWLCAGKCELGIKDCMPGGFCQTCERYEVDPDFIGQGPAGWSK
jgi:hypothetical protein